MLEALWKGLNSKLLTWKVKVWIKSQLRERVTWITKAANCIFQSNRIQILQLGYWTKCIHTKEQCTETEIGEISKIAATTNSSKFCHTGYCKQVFNTNLLIRFPAKLRFCRFSQEYRGSGIEMKCGKYWQREKVEGEECDFFPIRY